MFREIIYCLFICRFCSEDMFDKSQCTLTISIFARTIPSIGRRIYLRTAPITIPVVHKSYMNILNVDLHPAMQRMHCRSCSIFPLSYPFPPLFFLIQLQRWRAGMLPYIVELPPFNNREAKIQSRRSRRAPQNARQTSNARDRMWIRMKHEPIPS